MLTEAQIQCRTYVSYTFDLFDTFAPNWKRDHQFREVGAIHANDPNTKCNVLAASFITSKGGHVDRILAQGRGSSRVGFGGNVMLNTCQEPVCDIPIPRQKVEPRSYRLDEALAK